MTPVIRIFDIHGNLQTLVWALDKYGPLVIYPAFPATGTSPVDTKLWKLTALREKNDSALVCSTIGQEGPQPGVKIAFYWPDAPQCDDAGPLGAPFEGITPGRAVSGYTDVTGNVGFGMGPGAHYDPTINERGPHAAWVAGDNTQSDVILGLGMIPDDHLHLNPEWTLIDETQNGDEDLVALIRQLADNLHTIADFIEEQANG